METQTVGYDIKQGDVMKLNVASPSDIQMVKAGSVLYMSSGCPPVGATVRAVRI